MMQAIELRSRPDIKRIILAAFPSYRKLRAYLNQFPESGITVNSYWDGGSRDEYAIVHLPSMSRRALPTSTHPYFDLARHGLAGAENADLVVDSRGNATLKHLPAGFALVQAGTSCGKPATASIYMSSENQLQSSEPSE